MVSVVYHPVLPLDMFVSLVAEAGIQKLGLSQSAIEAFGVIRLRSFLERQSMRVASVHADVPGLGVRAELLAHILEARCVAGPPATLAAEAVSDAVIRAHGDSLGGLVRAHEAGEREYHLHPDAWRRLAQAQAAHARRT